MISRLVYFFVKIAGVLLLITALAKIAADFAGGTAAILNEHDPIFRISFRLELFLVAVLEIIIAAVCLFTKRVWLQLGLIAWLATNFAIYHLGLWMISYHICPCLGNIPAVLHLSTQTANAITYAILFYLLLGSYGCLIGKWLANRARRS
jgi:hypothetical protein